MAVVAVVDSLTCRLGRSRERISDDADDGNVFMLSAALRVFDPSVDLAPPVAEQPGVEANSREVAALLCPGDSFRMATDAPCNLVPGVKLFLNRNGRG